MANVKLISEIETLREEVVAELTDNILPYWMNQMIDDSHGGFLGRRNGYDEIVPQADKGVILNTRILWTFSHAQRILNSFGDRAQYAQTASRAYDYLVQHFIDTENGGLYWMVNFMGKPVYTKKQVYAQAFGIYAFAEYYQATGHKPALDHAIDLFKLLEAHSFDKTFGGYFEAFDRDWKLLEDQRLSDKDANESKTMNTHLHVLEAYTNLYRCWKNPQLGRQLKNLLMVFADKILDKQNHLGLFFDEQWNRKSSTISFGHDIEASWLLYETAQVLNDKIVTEKFKAIALRIVQAVEQTGINVNGAVINEVHADGSRDTDIHWWPQAEALVGFVNAWEISGDEAYLSKAYTLWSFIKAHLIDADHGEWHWRLKENNTIVRSEDKAGAWKCPYHNGRACMELTERLKSRILIQ